MNTTLNISFVNFLEEQAVKLDKASAIYDSGCNYIDTGPGLGNVGEEVNLYCVFHLQAHLLIHLDALFCVFCHLSITDKMSSNGQYGQKYLVEYQKNWGITCMQQ